MVKEQEKQYSYYYVISSSIVKLEYSAIEVPRGTPHGCDCDFKLLVVLDSLIY